MGKGELEGRGWMSSHGGGRGMGDGEEGFWELSGASPAAAAAGGGGGGSDGLFDCAERPLLLLLLVVVVVVVGEEGRGGGGGGRGRGPALAPAAAAADGNLDVEGVGVDAADGSANGEAEPTGAIRGFSLRE